MAAMWPTVVATSWMAQGKTARPRAAWEAALKALPRQASLRQFVQFKLDAVAH